MKWLKVIGCYLCLVLSAGSGCLVCQAQTTSPPQLAITRSYNRSEDSLILDSLRLNYGKNKAIPPAIELQALRALSHYPELRDIAIEFVFKRQKTAHTSQPKFSTILRRRRHRIFQVRISVEVPEFYTQGMHANLPYNAQIGVLGHELGHTVDYVRRRFLGLLVTGLHYSTSSKYVTQTEHATDQTAIDHGLGWQLLAWAQIAHPLLEKAHRSQNYLKPEEIEMQLSIPHGERKGH